MIVSQKSALVTFTEQNNADALCTAMGDTTDAGIALRAANSMCCLLASGGSYNGGINVTPYINGVAQTKFHKSFEDIAATGGIIYPAGAFTSSDLHVIGDFDTVMFQFGTAKGKGSVKLSGCVQTGLCN